MCSSGENQRGEESDTLLYPPMVSSIRVLKGIQGGEKDFSSLAEAKERMKRHSVQQGEGKLND